MKIVPQDIKDMRKNWNNMAEADPYWAVLTHDSKKDGKWSTEEFFATGRSEIAQMLETVEKLGLKPAHGRALDFGCGLGRLTQGLGGHFAEALGLDISDGMVAQARKLAEKLPQCSFRVNTDPDLKQLESASFDLVYSSITLQHIEPVYSREYLREFLRVLRPGGVLVFQLPSHRKAEQMPESKKTGSVLSRLYWAIREAMNSLRDRRIYREKIAAQELIIPMHGIPRPEVEALLAAAGGRVVDVQSDGKAGGDWFGFRYYVQKAG